MRPVSSQEKIRISEAKKFGEMLAQFWAMEPDDRIRVLNAASEFPTHPEIADNDDAIMAIAEAFWPEMKTNYEPDPFDEIFVYRMLEGKKNDVE